jgi:hypothetical protein
MEQHARRTILAVCTNGRLWLGDNTIHLAPLLSAQIPPHHPCTACSKRDLVKLLPLPKNTFALGAGAVGQHHRRPHGLTQLDGLYRWLCEDLIILSPAWRWRIPLCCILPAPLRSTTTSTLPFIYLVASCSAWYSEVPIPT